MPGAKAKATLPLPPPPVAAKRDRKVFFGKVEGEDRGPNPMDPPRVHHDPYFWLRDDDRKNPEVLAYLQAEKDYYEAHTADNKELVETIYAEHISHIQETDMSAPYVYGPFLYYTREVAGKSYKIHCRVPAGKTPGKPEDEEVLMDVNAVAEGKAFCDVAVIKPAPPKHELIAYSVDYSGNEVYTIEMLKNAAGVTDKVEGTNGEVIWSSDATAFFYITKDETLRDNKIWRHVIGQPQSSDGCLYEENDPLFSAFMDKSGDGHTLLIGSASSETTEVHLLDLRAGNQHTALELVRGREKGVRYSVEMHGTDTLVIMTNAGGAVNQKILVARRAAPGAWGDGSGAEQVLVPHSSEAFYESHCVLEKFMVVSGRCGGLTRVWTVSVDPADGRFHAGGGACPLVEEPMHEPVFTVEPVYGHMKAYGADVYRICYSSMATPNTWFDVNPRTHEKVAVKVKEVGGGFHSADYQVERRFATAPDQTKIPISLVYRKDVDRTKPQPCMLYGYGSYGISMDPEFSIRYLPYTERGMIYCIAHVRGGSELGRQWYEVGAKYLTKRNTFSDFIAVAEHLVESKLTTPRQLACEGRSAGGLLMGAVLNMRPDLFQVAIAGVPFVDVMTTMCDPSIPLTTGEWEEWGNPNEYKYYDYMLSYSPIDNVRAQQYPNIMIQAGLHDPRVAYWEPAKWVAKLRAHKTDHNELLLNMDLESGHFSAKDRYKYWRESAIQQAFVCKHLKAIARAIRK